MQTGLPIQADPFDQFQLWFDEAVQANLPDPTACVLATATSDARPSARVVLLKDVKEGAFKFFTNYESRKAQEIKHNPHGALVFFWITLGKQIRIEGRLEKTSRTESEAYFKTRPRESQIGAWASQQSHELPDYSHLELRFEELTRKFENKEVPCPPHWGGYKLVPNHIEFWILGPHRLHHRYVFERAHDKADWIVKQLMP